MWEKIVNNLSQQLTQPQYESWIKPIRFLRSDDQSVFVAVPSEYCKNWITKNLSKQIAKAIQEELNTSLELNIVVDTGLDLVEADSSGQGKMVSAKLKSSGLSDRQVDCLKRVHQNLNLKYTFDSFIVGPNNKFAYAMAKAVGDNPAKTHNPLFIYGGVGLGKTHLMQAIGHQVFNKFLQKKIRYLTTENFTNELIESIRRKTSNEFRSAYRQIDLLLLDDVQFLEGKENTQEELFNTFNALHEAGKQIVLSSDRPPKNIPNLAERLVSRFEWGIIVDIQPPDLETRIAILKNKAQADKMEVPLDVLELIATAYQNNIRELEGVLNRVIAYVGVTGCPMNVDSVRGLIESTSKARQLTPEKIIDVVAEYFKVSAPDIKGSSRTKDISQIRQVCIYLTREVTQLSFPSIGEVFGKKHSTIIYAYEKIKEEMVTNRSLANTVAELLRKVT